MASTAITATAISKVSANADIDVASGLTQGNGSYAYLNSSSDYLAVDAEI